MSGASQRSLTDGERSLPALVAADPAGGLGVAEELFALTDALTSSPPLTRALTDPATEPESKDQLLDTLLGAKFSPPVVAFLKTLVNERWASDAALPEALEQLGRDAALAQATQDGNLDQVERELFEVADAVKHADSESRAFLSDPENPVAEREAVVERMLAGKVQPATLLLAKRCTTTLPGRNFVTALQQVGGTIAARKARQVAQVTSAVELTEAQTKRLEAILQRKYGHAIEVYVSVDPAIIGGLRIEIGPDVIDDTVPTRVAEAREAVRLSAQFQWSGEAPHPGAGDGRPGHGGRLRENANV